MAFFVNRRSEICKSKNNRPGCCGYLCDKPREKNCKNCYSCYVNCPHDVYEVINDEPMAVHQERCVGCRICEGMCPTNAIYIQSMPDETRGVWDASTISEIRRKTQTGNYKVRGCGATRHIPTFEIGRAHV